MTLGNDRPADPGQPETGRAFGVRETLCRKQRLRKTSQFQQAYDQNRRWHGRHMVLFLRSGPDASFRLGVVASKRVGNAVDRARAKRRLREAFRRGRSGFAGTADDVVLVARRSILTATWSEVTGDLQKLAKQAGLVPANKP